MPETAALKSEVDRQLPQGEQIFLDHVGHFVRDAAAASRALARAGFAPTPVSVQANPDGTPTGTGNVTAMLTRGYIEVLFKTADTPLGQEFEAAVSQHPGLHLAAFAVGDASSQHARLERAGFALRPLVQFQRPVETVDGPDVAAFTVVRVERGAMAEGRIQMLTHRTEHTVWQPRWLNQPNGATGLLDLVIATADVPEAAARFERFTGCPAVPSPWGHMLQLDRGQVQLVTAERFGRLFPGLAIPRLPFMGVYAVQVTSVVACESLLSASVQGVRRDGAALFVPFPEELGQGAWMFVEHGTDLPWRRQASA